MLCGTGLRSETAAVSRHGRPSQWPFLQPQHGPRLLAYGVQKLKQAAGQGPRGSRRQYTSETSASFARRTLRPVRRFVERMVAFLKWLFTSEQLPSSSGGSGDPPRRGCGFEHWLFGKERLAEESFPQTPRIQRRGFLAWVLSPDQLQTVDGRSLQVPEHRQSFWSWLFSGGELPSTNLPENRERPPGGVLRSLLSAETLARQPQTASAKPRGFVRWLLSRETL